MSTFSDSVLPRLKTSVGTASSRLCVLTTARHLPLWVLHALLASCLLFSTAVALSVERPLGERPAPPKRTTPGGGGSVITIGVLSQDPTPRDQTSRGH